MPRPPPIPPVQTVITVDLWYWCGIYGGPVEMDSDENHFQIAWNLGFSRKGLEIPESKGKKVKDEGSSNSEKASLIDKLMKDAKGLCQDFKYTRMKNDETLSVYLTRLLELKLLISLTKEFDPVCYVIEQTKDIESIEVQEVIAALRGFAQRLDRHAESTIKRAFSSMSVNPRGTQSNSSFGGKYDQGGKPDQAKGKCKHCDKLHYGDCWFKGKPKCHGCNRFGHFIKDCDKPNKAGKLVNFANQCRVKMVTGDLMQSIGKGTLVIEMKGVTRYIKEVMIVPGLDENLLSVGQMVKHGYWLVFGDYMVDIYMEIDRWKI
ncbi:uncharacterized protein LOC108865628 [Pyrus x bretschneideri]|uniref:uncharacterized protein LOC108865628 n=1 Tax=Pyrus x bretschneideri TaxID=225117 RepID=UPI00202FED80|nr:uncharacterized protein LOC108865628 [Pyrus x bretschneideri]